MHVGEYNCYYKTVSLLKGHFADFQPYFHVLVIGVAWPHPCHGRVYRRSNRDFRPPVMLP